MAKTVLLSIPSVGSAREATANEYPVRLEPKGEPFVVTVGDTECRARTTSGRGKSAIPNFYLYWIEGETMFYVRLDAAEFAEVRKGCVIGAPGEKPAEEAPKKRVRAKA